MPGKSLPCHSLWCKSSAAEINVVNNAAVHGCRYKFMFWGWDIKVERINVVSKALPSSS